MKVICPRYQGAVGDGRVHTSTARRRVVFQVTGAPPWREVRVHAANGVKEGGSRVGPQRWDARCEATKGVRGVRLGFSTS